MFIEDIRHNGTYLRTTWHPERRLFVVSTWAGEVCTGAVRLPASEAPELVSLLVDGLAETATRPAAATPAGAAASAGAPPVGPRDAQGRPQDAPPAPSTPGRAGRPGASGPLGRLPDWATVRRWLRHRTSVPAPIPFGRKAARPPEPDAARTDAAS